MSLNNKIKLAFGFVALTVIFTLFNWFRIEYLGLFPLGLFFIYILLRVANIGIPGKFPKIVEKYIKKFTNYFGFYNETQLIYQIHHYDLSNQYLQMSPKQI